MSNVDEEENCEDGEKIIIRSANTLPGIDLALYDLSMLSSVPIAWSKVVEKMYKIHGRAYIGIKDNAVPQEIIQVGNLGMKYRIIGMAIKMLPRGGFLFQVKRIDGFSITTTDIEAIEVGQKVKFVNRKNFVQRMNYPKAEP